MPYTFSSISSFERSIKNLDPQEVTIIKLAIKAFVLYLANGNSLIDAQQIAPRFFFKQLRKPFYEIGIDGRLRIILRKEENQFTGILAGNHDDVRRFLARSG
jgi:hypothetical protein